MHPSNFIIQYERALGTQDWAHVEPLIHNDARVVFSDGSLHIGKDGIKMAYERNFQAIKGEKFEIMNIHWISETSTSAAYMFEFRWAGLIQGEHASGAGRGTTILSKVNGQWRLKSEQLGLFKES